MRAVVVAVGGGGDALTSAALGRLLGLSDPPIVMTYSWDRLLIDPLPGPRRATDFRNLRQLAPNVLQVDSSTTTIPPAGSSLPRIAAELSAIIILLDPSAGADGLTRQMRATVKHFGADRLIAVDVGGDALTDGRDAGLRSPLADQLALAGCLGAGLSTTLVIAAPGIDGEISPDTLTVRLEAAHATRLGRVTAADTRPLQSVLRWHPSEASGLLAAAAIGMRGTVEVRDAGDQVRLTDETVLVHTLELDAVARVVPASALVGTSSLDQADQAITQITGLSELRYEAAKAVRRSARPSHIPSSADLPHIDQLAAEAEERRAEFISMRRLAELVGVTSLDGYVDLTRMIAEARPGQYAIGAYRVKN